MSVFRNKEPNKFILNTMFLDEQITEDGQFIVNSFGTFFSEVYAEPILNIKTIKILKILQFFFVIYFRCIQ